MKNKMVLLLVALISALSLSACAPNLSANAYDYNSGSVGTVNPVTQGVIVAVRPVQVGANNGVGGVAGAVAGGAAGSAIGEGARAGIIGAVGGALVGGLLGNAIQSGISRQTAMEYIVRTTKGNLISVVQGAQTYLAVGTRVMVIGGAQAKIIPAN